MYPRYMQIHLDTMYQEQITSKFDPIYLIYMYLDLSEGTKLKSSKIRNNTNYNLSN